MSKTLRLLFPQWQGGNNPDYFFGAELLAQIVPQSSTDETVKIAVAADFTKPLPVENGVEGESQLLNQLKETSLVLCEREPEKVIVMGGDCSISQAPFDYLNGKYPDSLGVIWLDAHPDVATTKDSSRDHEMVLGNLLGHGAPHFAEQVKHPLKPNQVFFAGLIYDELRERDQEVNRLAMRYASPESLVENSQPIIEWIRENEFKHLAIHFDLDVLSPQDFRSIYPAEPYLDGFGAAVGDMTLNQVVRLMTDVSNDAEIVGLSIAEHMPWDAMNLRKALYQISIFND